MYPEGPQNFFPLIEQDADTMLFANGVNQSNLGSISWSIKSVIHSVFDGDAKIQKSSAATLSTITIDVE